MKNNYDKLMIEELSKLTSRKKILLHSCCGPCSTACIERLSEYLDITIIYYNPNIEPVSEYELRKKEQIRLLDILGIEYIDCDYDNDQFRKLTKRLSEEDEGGKRCSVCFGMRLKYTAKIAKKYQFDYFGTTLTVSPHKNSDIINMIGKKISENIGVTFLVSDFKKREGYKRSIELAKKYELYRQEYCGCLYSKRGFYEE